MAINYPYVLRAIYSAFFLAVAVASCSSRIAYALDSLQKDSVEEKPNLSSLESQLAERYDRLELLAGRLAELSRSTQPRRARLLRDMVSKSREQDIAGRFDAIVDALQQGKLAEAMSKQDTLQTDLQKLLELLLQEGRDREIESERKRIGKYIAEIKKLIRLQRGVKARTDGGDNKESLIKDQEKVANLTEDIRKQIKKTDGSTEADPSSEASKNSKNDSSDSSKQSENNQQEQSSENGKPSPSENSDNNKNQSDPSSSEKKQDDAQAGQSNQQSQADRATQQLQKARQRMQQAKKRLEEAQRKNAIEEQNQALRELEKAKAELERILRQLREEELERILVLLESRFRKMLDAQIEVYDQTKKLDESQAKSLQHELEIAAARISRKEQHIIRDADRAMVLLQEDGTSVAFPEALGLAIEDMQTVEKRLADVKFGTITQGLEEDIIATFEEILASLQQAIKDLREQSSQQQQAEGQPGEQSLVDKLSELRMIRALQKRVNRRTFKYDEMISGDQAVEQELLEALDRLAIRQERIFEATRDLDTNRNN